MKFEDYSMAPEVIKGIQKLGFNRPTDIQFKSIPPILRGEDVLAVAQTGTGKTAAFAIPILHQLHTRLKNVQRVDGVKCIVMVPTHELALQIEGVFKEIGRFTKVKVLGLIGGVDQDPQIETLEKRVDVLIATPGRMFDLISQGHLKVHRVETLILDEADHMLDLGFINDIRDLTRKLPARRQTLFFSATINDHIKKLAYSLIHQNAIRIQVSPKDPVAKNIEHAVAFIEMDDKRFFLERLVNNHEDSKILVFVRTKVRAERVSKAMERVGIQSIFIHSGKNQEERNEVMRQFRSGQVKVLVATDVTARGIDIPDVDYVVNYDLPDKAENYVHRVGRTGRGIRKGQAITFCSAEEKPMLAEVEKYVQKKIKVLELSKTDYEETVLFTNDPGNDLKKLMAEIEAYEASKKKKKRKKS
ncbi:MAG: DEAD/DEAH box helicase [Lewinellaceae bacterium]|nr:DEAD/DEAH box helicase [Saprospiraceae bacterium]MCB9337736.1 DEAD/DEAH box helicase [Lewinellaceae bacterium]